MDTLTEMGVYDHGYSRQQLIDLRICDFQSRRPINISVALDHKYDIAGVLSRRKVRMAVAGHKYNMTKGIHYDEVFASFEASPIWPALRLVMAGRRRW